jgi:hypothetical protein
MTPDTISRIVALGTITGMRSTAGPLALALRDNSRPLKALFGLMAAGEMAADKTSLVGNRIDPGPLAGRAAIGAIVGGLTARRAGASTPLGALLGAAAAVSAAHLAYRIRTHLPLSNGLGGVLEDALVLGAAGLYSSRSMVTARAAQR